MFISQPNSEPYYVRAGEKGPLLSCSVGAQFAAPPNVLNWLRIVGHSARYVACVIVNCMRMVQVVIASEFFVWENCMIHVHARDIFK